MRFIYEKVLILFLFGVLQTGCFHYERNVIGGGRVEGGRYRILEESSWTFWWLTIAFPSVMTNMTRWYEIKVEDGKEECALVDWMWWGGAHSPSDIPNEEYLRRWVLDGVLLQPHLSFTRPNQRILLLCNDLESYALLVQEERRLSTKYRNGPFALYARTGKPYTWVSSEGNCSLWVIQPDGTHIGPYWIPYVTAMENPYVDGALRSRYRTNALFCFEPKTQTLCALYKDENRYYVEYWRPDISHPVREGSPLPFEGEEAFYCWISETTVGVASWNAQTQCARFTTFNQRTLAPLSTTMVPHFPKPPPFEHIPDVMRKVGDWMYVFNKSVRRVYASFTLFDFASSSEDDLPAGEAREYILRFNLVTGDREEYYVKTK